jgi:hypothetical protein
MEHEVDRARLGRGRIGGFTYRQLVYERDVVVGTLLALLGAEPPPVKLCP